MYFCANSLPTSRMNEQSVEAATAFANMVFPHPGGPTRRTPLGGSIPNRVNDSGDDNGNSILSLMSLICSSSPPRSSYEISGRSSISAPVTSGSQASCKTSITDNVS